MRIVLCYIIFFLFIEPEALAQDTEFHELTEIASGLNDARSIYASSAGNLFIVEVGNHRILKLATNGDRIDSIGRLGNGDYQFDMPLDVDATNELKMYVADYNNRRIQIFDRRFQYLSTVELPQRFQSDRTYSPTKLDVNFLGQLFFYDEESRFIYKFDANGRYEQRFDTRGEDRILSPSGMVSTSDLLLIADSRQNIIHRLNMNGNYLGYFETSGSPLGIDVHDNLIYILVGNQVIVYDNRGQQLDHYYVDLPIRDIAVYRAQVFLLSSDKVYMMSLIR